VRGRGREVRGGEGEEAEEEEEGRGEGVFTGVLTSACRPQARTTAPSRT
jgi:hypothetical protein